MNNQISSDYNIPGDGKWPEAETAQAIDDFSWCEAMIAKHSGSFYKAFRHLRPDKAKAVFAIYAFCRMADDAVDEHNDAKELARLRDQLEAFRQGYDHDEPMWRALRLTFDRFDLNTEPYNELLTGLEMDLFPQQPANMAVLDRYCYLVAGTVGLMLNPLLAIDTDNNQTRKCSIKLGHAMQLTNILRDVGTDYRLGRTYVPADMMKVHGLSFDDLAGPQMKPELQKLWEQLAEQALSYYHDVEKNLDHYEAEARLPLLLSLNYYRSIIYACRRSDYNLLQRRIFVPDSRKLLLYWRTRLQLLLKRC